jgi:thymidylate synthase
MSRAGSALPKLYEKNVTERFVAESADDLLHDALSSVIERGERIDPTRGPALELTGVALELARPRARLSRSERRGKLFSALGELCWYLSESDSTDHIAYYIRRYADEDEGGHIHGAYGPRLFRFDGVDQIQAVIHRLRERPSSRRAVIQLFDRKDVAESHKDVPCTCTLQFLVRQGELQLITHMRSNDAYFGLPHDIFAFTMLQELVASSLGLPPGRYTHLVGSFHLYERDVENARAYLDEGWHSSVSMDPMPSGDPWPAVKALLRVEEGIRLAVMDPLEAPMSASPYWNDLAILLSIYRLIRDGRLTDVAEARNRLSSPVFGAHIDDRLAASL